MSDASTGLVAAAGLQPAGHAIGDRTLPKGHAMTTIEQPVQDAPIDVSIGDEPTRPPWPVASGSVPAPADRSASTTPAIVHGDDGRQGLTMHWSWVDGSPVARWTTSERRTL